MLTKIFRLFAINLAVLSEVVCVSPAISAQDFVSGAVGGQEIVVGSELDYPPYALVDGSGQAAGFSVDLMKATCAAVGLKVRFRVGPWSEVRAALEKDEIDALPLVSYSKEREAVFDFTTPHTIAHGAIFKRDDTPEIMSTSDLRDKDIIVMRSDAAHDWLLRNDVSSNLLLTNKVEESLSLLASGAQDYALAPRLVGLYAAKELKLENIHVTGPLIDAYGRGYGFAVKEGNDALLRYLNEGLSIIRSDGTYGEIYDKWFGAIDPRGVPEEVIYRYILSAVSGLLFVGALVVGWIFVLRRTVVAQTAEIRRSRNGLETTVAERTLDLAWIIHHGPGNGLADMA